MHMFGCGWAGLVAFPHFLVLSKMLPPIPRLQAESPRGSGLRIAYVRVAAPGYHTNYFPFPPGPLRRCFSVFRAVTHGNVMVSGQWNWAVL